MCKQTQILLLWKKEWLLIIYLTVACNTLYANKFLLPCVFKLFPVFFHVIPDSLSNIAEEAPYRIYWYSYFYVFYCIINTSLTHSYHSESSNIRQHLTPKVSNLCCCFPLSGISVLSWQLKISLKIMWHISEMQIWRREYTRVEVIVQNGGRSTGLQGNNSFSMSLCL